MINKYFEDEEITKDDLYFICYMIERVARRLHQHNRYVVNSLDKEEWVRLISLANVLHSENPAKIEADWIEQYDLKPGTFDIADVDHDLVNEIPRATQMGKVYMRLILDTLQPEEDYTKYEPILLKSSVRKSW